jgi:hypothetical protein
MPGVPRKQRCCLGQGLKLCLQLCPDQRIGIAARSPLPNIKMIVLQDPVQNSFGQVDAFGIERSGHSRSAQRFFALSGSTDKFF